MSGRLPGYWTSGRSPFANGSVADWAHTRLPASATARPPAPWMKLRLEIIHPRYTTTMSAEVKASPRLASGSRLGPYEIGDLIGAGGMGEMYPARDTRLARDVAVK